MATLRKQSASQKPPQCRPGDAHHWLVESPNGQAMVRAVCRHCKAEWAFPAAHTALRRKGHLLDDLFGRSNLPDPREREGPEDA